MDPKRQGEIALAILKYMMREKGIHLSPNNRRELGNLAKATDVSVEELKAFGKPLVQELLDDCFK